MTDSSASETSARDATHHLGPRHFRWLALALAFLIAMTLLAAAEGALRLIHMDPGLAAMRAAQRAGHPFDRRTRSRVVADLVAEGIPAVPRLAPAAMMAATESGEERSLVFIDGTELLPLAGISNRTTVLCNETGEYAVFQSDEHGFRNPLGLWSSPPIDLALIGDSYTIGACVAPGLNLADRLREEWPRSINLGYSGNSPLLELASLIEFGPSLRPRMTLWFYFENDLAWFDLERSRHAPLLMRYLEPAFSQSLVHRQAAIDRALTALVETGHARSGDDGPFQEAQADRLGWVEKLVGFVRLEHLRRELGRLRKRLRPSRAVGDYVLMQKILSLARDQTASWNGELAVIFLPGVWHFDPWSDTPNWAPSDSRERIRNLAESLNLRFLDIQSTFEKHPDPLSLYSYRGESHIGSPHMNADGYAVTIERVRAELHRSR